MHAASSTNGRPPADLPESLGQSEAFLDFQQEVSRAAGVDRPVLIVGERGTGKELTAARLHYLSPRWDGPRITLNCATLPSTLIEAELFGHEPGAFTGATQRRRGRFEAADSGTLFLDEIGMTPPEVQEKILRAVEYRTFERVGSSTPISVNVRLIAATNADLPRQVAEGRFRQDLLDRLSFEVLVVPPLREREGDILLLARHFASRMARELGRDGIPEFTDEAQQTLEHYAWPGNVRELKNVVERALYRSDSTRIAVDRIVFNPFARYRPEPDAVTGPAAESLEATHRRDSPGTAPSSVRPLYTKPLKEAVRDLEIYRVRRALADNHFNQRRAAESLGLTYHQFRGLYRKHAVLLQE